MIKKERLIKTSLVTLIPLFMGLVLWRDLPDVMPTTFGFNGEVTGTSSKIFAVVGLPAIILLCHIISIFFTANDPKNSALNEKIITLIYWICPLCSVLCGVMMYGGALNYDVNAGAVGTMLMGVMFIVIGNYLPKCRHNYTVGYKIPWTLASEENWNKTHRFAGWISLIGGILIFICGILRWWAIMLVITFAIAVIPVIYSYIYFKKYEQGTDKYHN